MHIVIMGCGRVGSKLGHSLESAQHSVAIIDHKPEAFRRLGSHFNGRRITGTGYDRDTLIEAGIEHAQAFAAVSNGDNSNILAARVARETFGIDNVVARIYDPQRAEVYTRLGIPTVATARWTADQMLRRLLPEGATADWSDASGAIVLAEVPYHVGWVGTRLSDLEQRSGTRVGLVTRFGEAMLPQRQTILQDGDILHLMIQRLEVPQVQHLLGNAPTSPQPQEA